MTGRMGFWHLLLTLLMPPVSVYLRVGPAPSFWVNLLLTLLGYLPGLLHAVWLLRRR